MSANFPTKLNRLILRLLWEKIDQRHRNASPQDSRHAYAAGNARQDVVAVGVSPLHPQTASEPNH